MRKDESIDEVFTDAKNENRNEEIAIEMLREIVEEGDGVQISERRHVCRMVSNNGEERDASVTHKSVYLLMSSCRFCSLTEILRDNLSGV